MSIIALLLMVVAALAVAYFVAMSGQPVFAALNESTAGTHTGNQSYNAGVNIDASRVVKLASPGDAHERTVVLFDGTGIPLGVSTGCSDVGEPVAIYVFGASHGSVKIKTADTATVGRLGKLVPAANGEAVLQGDASAVSTHVLGVALEGNDNNHDVQVSPADLVSILG